MKKKILIIGGTGFIGYHFAKKCLTKNWNVYSLSTKLPSSKRKINKIKYLICDIYNKKKLNMVIGGKKFDYVVNLGGHVDHTKKNKVFNSHYIGCKNLANYFLNSKIKKFLQVGSSVEYGHTKSPQKETAIIEEKKLQSFYGTAKLMATNLLLKYNKLFKFPAVVVRLYLVYGPKQDQNRFLPITINSCLKDKSFNCSHGKQLRDFIYIDDVVEAFFKILTSKFTDGQIINIGSGSPKKIKNVIKYLEKKLNGGKPIFGKIKIRKDEIMTLYPSIKKAKRLIGWRPKTNFTIGIKKTIRYFEKEIRN